MQKPFKTQRKENILSIILCLAIAVALSLATVKFVLVEDKNFAIAALFSSVIFIVCAAYESVSLAKLIYKNKKQLRNG